MEESTAKEILKSNFIGVEELSTIRGGFSISIPPNAPTIPFTEKDILSVKNTHLLLLCSSKFADESDITIQSIREKIYFMGDNPRFYNQDWYLNEKFITRPLETKWLLVSKSVLDESRAMPAEKVVSKYQLHSAVELTYAFFTNFFVNGGEKLWNNDYVWCSDVDDKGDQIYVGRYTDASGLNTDGFEIHRHLKIKNNYGVV